MRNMNRLVLLAGAMTTTTIGAFAQQPQTAPPANFSFDGNWSCEGKFTSTGKVHRNVFSGEQALNGSWIKLTETDLEPKGYIANYMVRYDSEKQQMEEVDVNNSGYAIYTGRGWEGNRLELTSTEAMSYKLAKNRFVYVAVDPETFIFSWEILRDKGWLNYDEVKCRKDNTKTKMTADLPQASDYLGTKLQAGETHSNIYSLAVSYQATGMDEVVHRVSGTSTYKVLSVVAPDDYVFESTDRYDGHPETINKSELKDHGRTLCSQGECRTYTDGSGLLYNALLWGEPKGELHKGMTWTVTIGQKWELASGGIQTVTVESVDPATHTVTLKREGSAQALPTDKKQLPVTKGEQKFTADVVPGNSHWSGYTTFREGLVISDELLMERPVKITANGLGSLNGMERAYFLLNAMPSGPS
ncbi:MAG: hypothetical protein ABI383_06495 [Acidobacteriaceae bacterium]